MDKIEFEELYLSCKTALERFVYYKMAQKSNADDILQEVAITAFNNISSVKNPESFKAWILKIAMNKCNDFYRALAKRHEITLDETIDTVVSINRYGISDTQIVRETLADMTDKDKQILFLYYFKNKPQSEIAQILKIPVGTVKSRLYKAKQNFKEAYPFPPELKSNNKKGEIIMKNLPDIMPEYKITPLSEAPFNVKFEESPGWFIIPRLGEKITWAIYEFADKKRLETTFMEVVAKASIHGIDGVEITAIEENPIYANQIDGNKTVQRKFVAQLTDTHCRFLAEHSTTKEGVKIYRTFLDGDNFNMYHGKDNCGSEVNLTAKGNVIKDGDKIICKKDDDVADIVGRYIVEINGKSYDTVCLVDIEYYNKGVFSEQYIDKNGRTVLWRRFNKNDWQFNNYKILWNEKLPENEQVTINGELYVHWYDCITDYIL